MSTTSGPTVPLYDGQFKLLLPTVSVAVVLLVILLSIVGSSMNDRPKPDPQDARSISRGRAIPGLDVQIGG